jgi:hypothetical protein
LTALREQHLRPEITRRRQPLGLGSAQSGPVVLVVIERLGHDQLAHLLKDH